VSVTPWLLSVTPFRGVGKGKRRLGLRLRLRGDRWRLGSDSLNSRTVSPLEFTSRVSSSRSSVIKVFPLCKRIATLMIEQVFGFEALML
jgi:hypothetical protein